MDSSKSDCGVSFLKNLPTTARKCRLIENGTCKLVFENGTESVFLTPKKLRQIDKIITNIDKYSNLRGKKNKGSKICDYNNTSDLSGKKSKESKICDFNDNTYSVKNRNETIDSTGDYNGLETFLKNSIQQLRDDSIYNNSQITSTENQKIPDGGEVTVCELREMAARQQHQIETQQQLLVAREQRLKYLKMQEGKAAKVNMEAEKLRRLRERVEAQEAKLRRLRALRGQVDSSNQTSITLSSDLDEMKMLFSEKEKELVVAAAKVEELTRQIEDIRNGRTSAPAVSSNLQKHHQELDKLRRELLYRNSVNREATARVASQKEALATRKQEIARIDSRIAELQQRLQRKKALNQQLATQISAATQAKQAQLKAIQQKELREGKREASTDDLVTEEQRQSVEGYSEFDRGKHDPKYQTLPYNTKFSSGRARPDSEESTPSPNSETNTFTSQVLTKSTVPLESPKAVSQQLLDNKESLPETSLSLSFAHKLSPGVTAFSQSRMHLFAKAQEAESQKNDLKQEENNKQESPLRPQLPPKPPVRPTPPPRQKGETVEVSQPIIPKITTAQQAFRYASQNVIMSTYTQKDQKQETGEIEKEELETPEKVSVSMKRRIEIPPAFLFPENYTPPDLVSKEKEDEENSNNVISNMLSALDSLQDELGPQKIDLNSHNQKMIDLAPLRLDDKNEDTPDEAFIPHDIGRAPFIDDDSRDDSGDKSSEDSSQSEVREIQIVDSEGNVVVNRRTKKGNLKTSQTRSINRRVSFDPLALLLDASLEGELELVKKTAKEVPNPSAANDEGITALHNAICAGHFDIVTFLVMYGYDVNAQDADGWTPLHCAASCNNVQMARFLVDHGACVLATTLLDHETAAEKCEQEEDGFDSCSQYLYSVQEKLGIMNGGVAYAVYDFEGQNEDEISFRNGEAITIIKRGDEYERNWWWSRLGDKTGYVPRNLLGLYPRVKNPMRDS